MKEEMIDFANGKVSGLFRRLFFPTVLGMVSMSAVTTIDGIFIGHGVGSDGIAAVNICVPLLMMLMGVGLMVGAGCSVLASVSLAHGKSVQARACVTHAMLFVTVISLVVEAYIILFPQKMAYMLGSSDHLMPLVVDYLLWFAPSLMFELWVAVALFAIRLDGALRLAMWSSVVSAVVNAVLDWLFIFPLGMGVMGAALATSLACLAGAGIAVWYLLFRAHSVRLHSLLMNWRGLVYSLRDIALQCKIGSSALLGELTMSVLLFVGNHVFMSYAGDDGVGAFGVSCYYLPFVFMIGNAIAQSAQPIISYSFGIGDTSRVNAALRVSLMASVICGIISTAAFVFFPKLLVGLFLPLDNAAARMAVEGFPYYGSAFIFFVMNLSLIGYYQSIERVKPAVGFSLLRGFVFLIPSFMLLPQVMGVKGVWLALAMSEILTLLSILLFYVGHAKTGRTLILKGK